MVAAGGGDFTVDKRENGSQRQGYLGEQSVNRTLSRATHGEVGGEGESQTKRQEV